MKSTKQITFTARDLEILRLEAERARAEMRAAGMHPRQVYEEKRHEFVHEYRRGALDTLTGRQERWAKQIKKELTALRRRSAARAGSTTSRGARSSSVS